jgi:electron transport complex protein RnfG
MSATRTTARSAGLLAAFALVSAGLIAVTHQLTADRIRANQRTAELAQLHSILAPGAYDNDLVSDTIRITAPDALGSEKPLTVYRARKDGDPVAAILTVVAPDGYNGPIRLLVGIRANGEVAGVRVLEHDETPGLGDGIEASKSEWIEQFRGTKLGKPPREDWDVRQDGGEFDALTGATITPRAVVDALRRALAYFEANRERLFAATESSP